MVEHPFLNLPTTPTTPTIFCWPEYQLDHHPQTHQLFGQLPATTIANQYIQAIEKRTNAFNKKCYDMNQMWGILKCPSISVSPHSIKIVFWLCHLFQTNPNHVRLAIYPIISPISIYRSCGLFSFTSHYLSVNSSAWLVTASEIMWNPNVSWSNP